MFTLTCFLIYCLSQVLCDRHFGGINYPVGGVGGISKSLAKGLVDQGSEILYKANVTSIIIDQHKAVSLTLVSNDDAIISIFHSMSKKCFSCLCYFILHFVGRS